MSTESTTPGGAGKLCIRRALISVWDKTGIVDFARALHGEFGVEIISTGGTAKALTDAGIPVTLVETLTGCGEMLGGRVKTLHPAIHAAILADRDNPEHMRQLEAAGIKPIDMVVVNLYPFEKTVADPNYSFEQAIEMIDIGGVALLRAAAKNHRHVLVPVYREDLEALVLWLREDALTDGGWAKIRRDYATSAIAATSRYDGEISRWLSNNGQQSLQLTVIDTLRYGENPQQQSTVQQQHGNAIAQRGLPWADFMFRAGVEMSHNNYLDADAALGLCAELTRAATHLDRASVAREVSPAPSNRSETETDTPREVRNRFTNPSRSPTSAAACVFIKHTNACGVGVHADPIEAYKRAYLGDPNAAMGGILAVNFAVDAAFAAAVMETYDRLGKPLKEAGAAYAPGGFFVEVWIAPRFTDDAVAIIRGKYEAGKATPEEGEARVETPPKKKWGENVRLLAVDDMAAPLDPNELQYRSIAGGLLVQSPDLPGLNESDWKVVTKRTPTDEEMADLRLAWLICKHTKSNAISLVKDGRLIGNGAGQMSRVMSCRVATWLARENGHLAEVGLGDRSPTGLFGASRAVTEEHLSRRHLPHIERPEAVYFITFRLRSGLLTPDERSIVFNACRYWHGSKMTLHSLCVMPDHVHLLLTPYEAAKDRWVPLGELLKSIKGYSAGQVNKRRNASGQLWQDENFDRIIRDERDFREKLDYMWNNPVTAGLVSDPQKYQWTWTSRIGFEELAGSPPGKPLPKKDRSETGPPTGSPPVAASDAFFPFSDGPKLLMDAGVTAIIQPGGSKRDQDTIDLCDERGVAMIFTGTRHFRH
ncbi:MAG: bifunctional phosphoribosylaminoimidazolecarboxamide formyltransferase/IMP cyclohydrolase [Phycisphaerales bacterium]|nr:bifunctional phosphoribosylaminoimidazolecarboxamide formyltransferase/IMP cyclohydrolase [Phycisphaerales bacterium]